MTGKLAELLESGQFDWDNGKHREAYLKAWAAGQQHPLRREEGGPVDR